MCLMQGMTVIIFSLTRYKMSMNFKMISHWKSKSIYCLLDHPNASDSVRMHLLCFMVLLSISLLLAPKTVRHKKCIDLETSVYAFNCISDHALFYSPLFYKILLFFQ